MLSTKKTVSGKIVLKTKGEVKTFQDKQKLRESIITRPVLQEKLKRILQVEMQLW